MESDSVIVGSKCQFNVLFSTNEAGHHDGWCHASNHDGRFAEKRREWHVKLYNTVAR